MSQTLTKPVLLDETGQEIVEKLDDIKEAISTGSEFTPVLIKVTTPPAKVAYSVGETLDLSGIVVSLIASNGVQVDVTDQCTFVPANGTPLTSANTSVAISYYWYRDDVTFTTSVAIGVKSLLSIAITTPPTQTEYNVGDHLDLTGMVVIATYDDGSLLDVTSRCTFNPANGATLSSSDTTITVTYTEGITTKTATQAITVDIPVYGVEWDGSATTAFTRTDMAEDFTDPVPYYSGMSETPSSPFDSIAPWSEMVKETRTGGVMVKIPKFYYKIEKEGKKLKIQITPKEYATAAIAEGFLVSPAHRDRGDGNGERDYVYIGRYHCASDYTSKTGENPLTNVAKYIFRPRIHQLGEDIWQNDFAIWMTIRLLYLVEFADWDSQTKIGFGCGSTSGYMGYTDSMPYHTGTTQTSRTLNGLGTQYRYIEGLWDNVYDWCDGIYFDDANVYMINNPTDFSDSTNGTLVGTRAMNTGSSFIKEWDVTTETGYEGILLPSDVGGSDSTYICDGYWSKDGSDIGKMLNVGYYAGNSKLGGMFSFSGKYKSIYQTETTVGSRIMELPANS